MHIPAAPELVPERSVSFICSKKRPSVRISNSSSTAYVFAYCILSSMPLKLSSTKPFILPKALLYFIPGCFPILPFTSGIAAPITRYPSTASIPHITLKLPIKPAIKIPVIMAMATGETVCA